MVSRTQIDRLAQRIEALGRSDGPTRYVVVDPSQTNEQALAQCELELGPVRGGTILFIHTGVPRSPECRGWGLSAGWTGKTDSHGEALTDALLALVR